MNKVFMIGRLAADPELRTTQSGTPVATYRLAVNRRRSAEATQEADFFPCVAWGKGAEFAAKSEPCCQLPSCWSSSWPQSLGYQDIAACWRPFCYLNLKTTACLAY